MKTEKKSYSELLRDPRWQAMRLKVMERDLFACRICDSDKNTLNVHHLAYRKGKLPWEADPNELLTVCEGCHEEIEKTKVEIGILLQNRSFLALAQRLVYSSKKNPANGEISCLLDVFNFLAQRPNTCDLLFDLLVTNPEV